MAKDKLVAVNARPTKGEDVQLGKMTPTRWTQFLQLIAAGCKRGEAEKTIGLSSYVVQVYLIEVAKAKDEYAAAQLEWVRREMDPVAIDGILERIAEGVTVKKAAEEFFLSSSKFHSWVMKDPLIAERYDEARKIQAEVMLDDMLEIADDGANDTYVDSKGNTRTDYDVVQRSKLRIEQRRWQGSKVNPDRFGDKVKVDQKIETTVNHVEALDSARRRKEDASKKRAELSLVKNG
jgi:hypothetical protein